MVLQSAAMYVLRMYGCNRLGTIGTLLTNYLISKIPLITAVWALEGPSVPTKFGAPIRAMMWQNLDAKLGQGVVQVP